MRVFVTGASGFIGSAVVAELVRAGHQVMGLARSDASAASVAAAGAEAYRGSLEDPESLRRAAESADGVIHTAFIHDFANMEASCRAEAAALEAMGAVLGTEKPLLITSGTALVSPGRVATEDMRVDPAMPFPRKVTELTAGTLAERGVRTSLLRMPPSVHGEGDHGFVPALIAIARQTGVSGFIGDGGNRWPSVHRLDAAVLYRLALEKGARGVRYHAVADSGVPTREIAEVIGRHLNVPVEQKGIEHFGWLGHFFALDAPASSQWTREQLAWSAGHCGLIEDLEQGHYFAAVTA